MSRYTNVDIGNLCAALGIDSRIVYGEDGRAIALPDPAGLLRLREDAVGRGFFALVPLFDELIRHAEDL